MRNTTKTAASMTLAILMTAATMGAPIQAQAFDLATKLPGTCDLVKNTACNPASVLDRLLAIIKWA